MSTEKTLIGPYVLHDKLGSHRRHHVYRATHEESGQPVAIKLVNISSRVERSTALKKIQLESKILRRLDHPNLVKTLDAGVVDNQLYIVMELIEGESLAAILSRRGKLAWDLAVEYARQIVEGLEYIHKQELVHLKLNPDKILLASDGTIKIADLRLNRARKRRWDETKRRVLDIAAYMAPEQMTEEGGTFKSDLYGVGVLMFEMITGRLPCEPDTLPRLIKAKQEKPAPRITEFSIDCPVWVDNLVAQLLESNPANRPHSTYAFLVSIREIQRMHAAGSTMAEELTRGFNPLTAGHDKSEAYQVLGHKKKKKPISTSTYAIPFLAAALLISTVATVALFWWAIRPPSEQRLYDKAVVAYEQEVNDQNLIRARRSLEPLLERFPDGEYAEEATEMLDSVNAQLAERRMKRRFRLGRDPKSESEKMAIRAWQLEDLGDREQAIAAYEDLIANNDDHEDAEVYRLLASRKLAMLNSANEDDAQAIDDRRDRVTGKLAEAAQLEKNGRLVQAREILDQIVDSYEDDPDCQDLVEAAKERIGQQPPDIDSESIDGNPVDENAADANSVDDSSNNDGDLEKNQSQDSEDVSSG